MVWAWDVVVENGKCPLRARLIYGVVDVCRSVFPRISISILLLLLPIVFEHVRPPISKVNSM